MKKLCAILVACAAAAGALAQANHGWLAVEEEVAAAVKGPQVTVVHLWAPWCPNSTAELANDKWAKFIELNRDVRFVFVTVRSVEDGTSMLAEHKVGGQPNLTLLQHPNQVKKGEGVIQSFMDIPVSWVPTTWVFHEGRFCYALNYGEVRFLMLQQMIRDAAGKWEH